MCLSSFLRIICSSPLSLKKSSLKAESTPVLSMPNILGIIHLLGKMEGTSMESDLIRSPHLWKRSSPSWQRLSYCC